MEVALERGGVIGRQEDGLGAQAVLQSVLRGSRFAFVGARSGGMFGVGAVDGRAIVLDGLGVQRHSDSFASIVGRGGVGSIGWFPVSG